MRRIRTKILVNSVLTLLIAFMIVAALVYYGISNLSSAFVALSERRAGEVTGNLEAAFERDISNIRQIYQASMERKGRSLVEKDRGPIAAMVEDNSFLSLRRFLEQTAREDPEIVFASFFVEEDGEIKAWQVISRRYPRGLTMPIEYRRKIHAWEGRDATNRRALVDDPEVPEIIKSRTERILPREIELESADGARKRVASYDCSIPVLGRTGAPVGFLRYVLSLEEMERRILAERAKFEEDLGRYRRENAESASEARRLVALSLARTFGFLGAGIVLAMALGYVLSLVLSDRILKPIHALTRITEKMAKGEYRQDFDVHSDDEIGIFAGSFKDMSVAILKRDEELAAINRNLERLVEERTLQLKEQLLTISNLLNNMKQAVFTVDAAGVIIPPVSRFSENIFGFQIGGANVLETVFRDIPRDSEELSRIKTVFATIYGESELQWSLMEQDLPPQVGFGASGEQRVFKIAYSPLWGDHENLEKLMLVIEDITEVLALERKIKAEKTASARRIQIIQELAENETEELRRFFSGAATALEDSRSAAKTIGREESGRILKSLHTLKGNARMMNFSIVSGRTHQAESAVLEVLDGFLSGALPAEEARARVLDQLSGLQMDLDEYGGFAKKVFRIGSQGESATLEVPAGNLERLGRAIRELKTRSPERFPPELAAAFDGIMDLPAKAAFQRFAPMVKDVAERAGKQVRFKVRGADLTVDRGRLAVLSDAIVHLLRNSLDHGIEPPAERATAGKDEVATLEIECGSEGASRTIAVRDDGRGVNVGRLVEKALAAGMIERDAAERMSFDERLALMFLPSLSTKDDVTELSGRGVGMDIVKSNVEKLGGSLKIRTGAGKGTEFLIQLEGESHGVI